MANPHTLVLRLLEKLSPGDPPSSVAPILNLCHIYCSALLTSKNYRSCVAVCRDFLSILPGIVTDAQKQSIEYLFAKALRMAGDTTEAATLIERLLTLTWSKDEKIMLQLNLALALQALDEPRALTVAKEVIKADPKSPCALQAESIVLEMESDIDNSKKLLKLEIQARKKGFDTVANNLALKRLSDAEEFESSSKSLRQVYSTALSENDYYTAARAAVKIAAISLRETQTLSNQDLTTLIGAYQYFYGERLGSLFMQAHTALWDFFQEERDIKNLLSLFRHSSFIWRLHGNEKREQHYVELLTNQTREILSTDILSADKNTAYFLIRARDAMQSLTKPG